MNDWNVVITVHDRNIRDAITLLEQYGRIARTDYFNVAVMNVDEPLSLMEKLREKITSCPELLSILARVVPAEHTFNFQTPEDFRENAKKIVVLWASRLREKKFHIRMHRRGFKGRLSSMEQEKYLDNVLLDVLQQNESQGYIEFSRPDMILSIETIGQRAGLSLWTDEELKSYPLLGLN